MARRRQNPVCCILALCYFITQVAFSHAAESRFYDLNHRRDRSETRTNFWAERKKKLSAISSQLSADKSSSSAADSRQLTADSPIPHLASLPLFLPPIRSAIDTLPKWSDANKHIASHLSPRLKTLIDSIPLSYGNIQEVDDPAPPPTKREGQRGAGPA